MTLHRKCGPPSLCPTGKSTFNSDLNEEVSLPAKRSRVQPSPAPQHSRTRGQREAAPRAGPNPGQTEQEGDGDHRLQRSE